MTGLLSSGMTLLRRLSSEIYTPLVASVNCASGRWYPQPPRLLSTCSKEEPTGEAVATSSSATAAVLDRNTAAPVYAPQRGTGLPVFGVVPWKNGEQLADYVLFEESIARCKVPWKCYSGMTKEERDIYMVHLRAVEERRLFYKDPHTGLKVMTVSQLLLNGKCCGNACRHCPYEMENVPQDVRKTRVWNGAFYT